MPKIEDDNFRFYVTDGPLAMSLFEVDESYFRECRSAGRGSVRVSLPDGTTEWITGSRYLEPDTRVRAEVVVGEVAGPRPGL